MSPPERMEEGTSTKDATSDPQQLFDKSRDSEFDSTDRNLGLTWILGFVTLIATGLGIKLDDATIDLDESNLLAGAVATCYSYLRRTKNSSHDSAKRYGEYKVKGKDKAEFVTAELVKDFKEPFDAGVVTPIINMITSFKLQMDEVRMGVTRFTVNTKGLKRDKNGKKKDDMRGLADYGLTSHHIPLLEGITFPPERRTGLARGMGPLALAISAIHETTFKDKQLNALYESIQMLPMAGAIRDVLSASNRDGHQSLLQALGDVLLLTGARTTHRLSLPLILFYQLVVSMEKEKKSQYWSFSGPRMQYLLQKYLAAITFKIRTNASQAHMKQVVFHAMYGTAFDDLGVLATITNQPTWAIRSEIGDTLQRKGTTETVQFKPILLKYVSKMSRALQTKAIGNAAPCEATRCSWSGFRERSLADGLAEYLRERSTASQYAPNSASVAAALVRLKNDLMSDTNSGKLKNLGTVDWFSAETGLVVDPKVKETGYSFYGNKR